MAASSSSLVSIEASFSENLKGFILAVVSSAFIGSSFIVKKLGLQRAGASGIRARKQCFPFSRFNFYSLVLTINNWVFFIFYFSRI